MAMHELAGTISARATLGATLQLHVLRWVGLALQEPYPLPPMMPESLLCPHCRRQIMGGPGLAWAMEMGNWGQRHFSAIMRELYVLGQRKEPEWE